MELSDSINIVPTMGLSDYIKVDGKNYSEILVPTMELSDYINLVPKMGLSDRIKAD
jgi:hypothetical protein